MSYRQQHYQIPDSPLGRSFRLIINNDELIQGRKDLLAAIKNTARQWFPNQNILDNPFVLPEGRVRYVAEMISRPWGMKGPDRMWCEGITIPLRASSQSLYSEMELCIAAGNGQLSSTKPTVGLRGKHKRTGHWTPIDWIPNPDELRYLFRRELRAAYPQRQIDDVVIWPDITSAPGMLMGNRYRGSVTEDSDAFKGGFFAKGIGTPQLRLEEIYGEAEVSADKLLEHNRLLTPHDRIDFTKMQLAMADGFARTSRPEASAQMASVGIGALCSRCVARYGLPGDPKRANFLSAELDDPENPWLPGKTADETYLWMIDYIYNMLGDCQSELLAKPIAEAIGEPLLEAMANAALNAVSSTSIDRLALITNLRKAHAQTAE